VAPIATTGGRLAPGATRKLLERTYYAGFSARGLILRGYDVSPDGQRFLMIKGNDVADARSVVNITLNWSPTP